MFDSKARGQYSGKVSQKGICRLEGFGVDCGVFEFRSTSMNARRDKGVGPCIVGREFQFTLTGVSRGPNVHLGLGVERRNFSRNLPTYCRPFPTSRTSRTLEAIEWPETTTRAGPVPVDVPGCESQSSACLDVMATVRGQARRKGKRNTIPLGIDL